MDNVGESRNEPSGESRIKTQTRTTYETSDPRAHYVELDALRGIAIFGVVITHIASFWFGRTRLPLDIPLLNVDLLDLFRYGSLGVMLFFLLSGYLLTWTEEKRARQGSYNVLSYAKRRAFRLVPAYYASIALIVLLWPTNPSFGSVAIHLTFLHGFVPEYPTGLNAVVWSLTPEVVFYAILPFLVFKFRKLSQRLVILGILVAVSLATRLLMVSHAFDLLPFFGESLSGSRMYFFPTTFLYLFLVGALLRMMVEHITANPSPGRWQLPVASALTVIPVALLLVFPYLVMGQGQSLSNPASMIAEGMVILIFISALLGSPILKPILNWRPLAFLGEISYSLFLLHTTVIFLMLKYVFPGTIAWVVEQSMPVVWATFVVYTVSILVVASAVSYLSYRYIESPFLRHKQARRMKETVR